MTYLHTGGNDPEQEIQVTYIDEGDTSGMVQRLLKKKRTPDVIPFLETPSTLLGGTDMDTKLSLDMGAPILHINNVEEEVQEPTKKRKRPPLKMEAPVVVEEKELLTEVEEESLKEEQAPVWVGGEVASNEPVPPTLHTGGHTHKVKMGTSPLALTLESEETPENYGGSVAKKIIKGVKQKKKVAVTTDDTELPVVEPLSEVNESTEVLKAIEVIPPVISEEIKKEATERTVSEIIDEFPASVGKLPARAMRMLQAKKTEPAKVVEPVEVISSLMEEEIKGVDTEHTVSESVNEVSEKVGKMPAKAMRMLQAKKKNVAPSSTNASSKNILSINVEQVVHLEDIETLQALKEEIAYAQRIVDARLVLLEVVNNGFNLKA